MTFMRKFMDMLDMDNWGSENRNSIFTKEENMEIEREKGKIINYLQIKINHANNLINAVKIANNKEKLNDCIKEIELLFPTEVLDKNQNENNTYNKYYENIRKQQENNLHITYEDMKVYDKKPFDLNNCFISDEHFTVIELSGANLESSYNFLKEINVLLYPYKYLYEDAEFPEKISVGYMPNSKLPISHLRLLPYTATMRKSKYPLALWLSNIGYYGTEYIYVIYFDKEGNIGQCELSLHGTGGEGISYETKVRRNQEGLYILRINKTLYSSPYGTTTIYHCKEEEKLSEDKVKKMSKYDTERYAIECNAYVVHKEREERQKEDNKIQGG